MTAAQSRGHAAAIAQGTGDGMSILGARPLVRPTQPDVGFGPHAAWADAWCALGWVGGADKTARRAKAGAVGARRVGW